MDGLFLRQVWSGNEALLESLARQTVASRGDAADTLHYFLINKGPWSRLDHNKPFVPGVPGEARGRQLLPCRRDEGRNPEMDGLAARRRQDGGDRLLHDDPPRPRRPFHGRAVLGRISGRAGAGRVAAAGSGGAHGAADAQGVPDQPRRRLHLERLLRERRRVDGARRVDRADDRSRTRSTRTNGSTSRRRSKRSSRFATRPSRRSCRSFGAELQGLENALPIDPALQESQARRARADQGRQRRLHRRRCQPRRADRGVQPPQRRARRQGEGHEARDAEERAGSQVQDGRSSRSRRSRCRRRSRRTSRSTRSSRTS